MKDGFALRIYTNVPIIMDRYPFNQLTRKMAIDAVRHPGPRGKKE